MTRLSCATTKLPAVLAAAAFIAVGLAASSAAEDVVHLSPAGEDTGRVTVRGQIVDYTGEAITIDLGRTRPQRYGAARVLEIETAWNRDHQAGREALARHDYRAAADHLAQANRAEPRPWARRLILTDLMRCRAALGEMEQAGDLFLAIVGSDPSTPAYAFAPLSWTGSDGAGRQQAERWLAQSDQPAAVLLGASHLLATPAAATARAALAQLLDYRDERVAALAEAQLWRAEIYRATEQDCKRWSERIERMPDGIRAGPYFVLGQARERLGQADGAAIAYLQVAVLFPDERELAARSLAAAGRLLNRSGHPEEAAGLWQEIVTDFAGTSSAAEARQLLQASP